jgi:drug/metabolite transporter (DMT)-like permease
MTSYLVPVLTLVMAVVVLGDRPEPLQLLGGLVILAGVRVATLRLARDAQPMPEGAA